MPHPIIESVTLTIVALIFLAGAGRKLIDLEAFEQAVASYELTNDLITWVLSRLIPFLELSAGLLLLAPKVRDIGALAAICLLVFVTTAVTINLLRGRTELSCGCGGFEEEQPISWNLVLRNLTLIGLVGLAFLKKTETAFSWLDLVTIYASSLVGFGIFAVGNQLSVNRIRLSNLPSARREA